MTAYYRQQLSEWAVRIALSTAFLSAVADRFGLWGPPGAPGVAWGDWAHFRSYSDMLNAWLPAALHPSIAAGATVAEVVLAVGLIVFPARPWVAAAAGALLTAFALTMTFALRWKAPIDYAVWVCAAAAWMLATNGRSTR